MSNLKKNLIYSKEVFFIQLKGIKEYKINMYLSLLVSLFVVITMSLMLNIIYVNFNSFLNWSFDEFYFFLFFSTSITVGSGIFWFVPNLKYQLLSGNLNIFLTKPINIFLQHLLSTSYLFLGVSAIFYFSFLIYFIIFSSTKILLYKFIITILFSLLSSLLMILLSRFLDSFTFYFKHSNLITNNLLNLRTIFDSYPATMFNGKIVFVILLFPNVYYGAYATEFLFGHINFSELLSLLKYVLIYIFICLFGIIINWHYGLKKYEAFG